MTLGSSPDQISKIFKMMGVIIGGLGTVLGLVLGLGLCLGLRKYGFPLDERIFGMSALPIHIKPLNFILVGICSFLICAVATIYPARRAASLEPSMVLRG
jgi:lipoprotein-releasing system permease protein